MPRLEKIQKTPRIVRKIFTKNWGGKYLQKTGVEVEKAVTRTHKKSQKITSRYGVKNVLKKGEEGGDYNSQ